MDFALAVAVWLPVLQVYDSHKLVSGQHGHRQECLVEVLGQFVKRSEPWILESITRDSHRCFMLGNPTGDALSYLSFNRSTPPQELAAKC